MLKKYCSLIVLVGGLLFAQTNDLQKNKINHNPKSIEESNTKAVIKANIVEEYLQEYYTKTAYNTAGNIKNVDFYNESGDLVFTENYFYNDNLLSKVEGNNPDESFIILKEYEYFDGGYKEITSENDVIVKEIVFTTNNKNITAEKEINMINNQMIERNYEYLGNNLKQTTIKYGKDGNIIQYKYDDLNLPIEEVIYDLKNNLISKKRRKFDENKNIIEENLFDNNGRLKTNNRIKYQYDDYKNWIKRTQYANTIEEPISNSTRTIRY